jgi:hypothetical protein
MRVILGLAVAASLMATSAQARDLVVHAGTLIDGVSAQPRKMVSILIHDDKITAVREGFVS